MFTLPEDIIFTEILPRISSIKSLVKFKSVSKPWCSLISSENFVKTQLHTSSVKSTSLTAVIILKNDRYSVGHCDVDVLFSTDIDIDIDVDIDQFDIDYPIPFYYYSIDDVVGCCNGLYCILLDRGHFILVNPYTRKYYKLPHFVDEVPSWRVDSYGYGESNDDYKVFTQFYDIYYGLVSKLYSLKTNSWKIVEGPYFSKSRKRGVFLNGRLHWPELTVSDTHSHDIKIVTFDLGSEMVGVVEQPNFAHGMCEDPELMSVIQGCLCVVHCDYPIIADVWIMKEYGVKESWCKLMSLPDFGQDFRTFLPDFGQDFRRKFQVPVPICISQEGDVFVQHGFGLLVYNPKTKSHMHPRWYIPNVPNIGLGIQSLVSPFPSVEYAN